ncbi:MAG: phosphatidylinositol-specific phospholipase C domain-containing protein, partial [Sedimentisphaerales bacterium]|nr:phosphatidylinositol-specific phospholipase C domain-containing protein [Sedimentisphaerales bacterium]
DSGARFEPIGGTAKCQNLTIAEQLAIGVRALDIRCRHIDNAFTIHHGQVYQNMNFTDVLNACSSFLAANPSETIIMSVKEEYNPSNNTRTFVETFNSYVNQNPGLWHMGTKIPALGQVRGKIVLFRRFGGVSNLGLEATSWGDDTTFSIGGIAPMRVQDNYSNGSGSEKWTDVNNMLNEAKNGSAGTLYVNFTSGYTSFLGIPSITTVSNYVNPRLETYFNSNPSGRFGMLMMDFVNDVRAEKIYKTNNFTPAATSTRAYWRFEDGIAGEVIDHLAGTGIYSADINDYSGNGNHLSTWTTGGGAGYNSLAEVASVTIPRTTQTNSLSVRNSGSYPGMFCGNAAMRSWTPAAFTLEATIKFQSGSYRTYIGRDSYGKCSSNASLAALYIQATPNNALAFKFCDSAGVWHEAISANNIIQPFNTGSAPYADDVPWYSLAAISDGKIMLLYLLNHNNANGYQLIAQADISNSSNTSLTPGLGSGADWLAGNFTVGRGMYNAQHGDRGYGYIDEVRFTDGALDVYQLLYSPITKKAVAWYRFENNLLDSSNSNHGTAPGAAASYAAGRNGQGLSLNGSTQYAQIPLSISESFTIAMWIKTTSTGGTGGWWEGKGLVDAERPNSVADFGTVVRGNKFGFGVGNPDTTISSTTVINNNAWHHCVATRDNYTGQMKVYVDGVLQATANGPVGPRTSPTNLSIGRINTGINYTAGTIDEIKLFNYPLSAEEVANIYNQ